MRSKPIKKQQDTKSTEILAAERNRGSYATFNANREIICAFLKSKELGQTTLSCKQRQGQDTRNKC